MRCILGIFAAVSLSIGFLPALGFEPEAMDCTGANLSYVKFMYKSNIVGINDAVQLYKESHPGYDMKSLANYIYTPFLNKVADSAKCLEALGVDPMTVAQFSNESRTVLEYNPAALAAMAPLFVQYVPIPEFDPQAGGMLLGLGLVVGLGLRYRNGKCSVG